MIFGTSRAIGTIGVRDLVVVETREGLLVCSTERAQEVKDLARRLREAGA